MRIRSLLAALSTFSLIGCAPSLTPQQTAGDVATMAEPRELTADQQVAHVLSRLTFGARPGDVQRVREMGIDAWIALQLQPQRIDNRVAEQFVAQFPTLRLTAAQLLAEYERPQQLRAQLTRDSAKMTSSADSAEMRMRQMEVRMAQVDYQRLTNDLQTASVVRALLSERQLEEVMVAFWLNHFSVFANKGQVRYYLSDYDRAIRAHALGNFRNLLEAVAKSPAMLFYLDNVQSSVEPDRPSLVEPQGVLARGRGRGAGAAGGIVGRLPLPQPQRRGRGLNENYARELMELHTLGVDGGYTQQDVVNVARALTGWAIDNPQTGGNFAFRPAAHDAGSKTVLGVGLPAGRGIEDGEQVLDILARHPSTARFIATKLARRFVADTPPATLVDRAAATFTRTNGDIREVVRTIVTSQEFFAESAFRSKVKTPFELVASALRALNAVPDLTPLTSRTIAQLGQPLFLKETPNGYPDMADAWLNTGSILNRINFGTMVVSGQLPGIELDRWPTARAVRNAPREQQVDAVVASLLGGAASTDTRGILMTGRNPLLEASAADSAMALLPDGPAGAMMGRAAGGLPARPGAGRGGGRGNAVRIVPLDPFAQIVGLALGSPEFQRR